MAEPGPNVEDLYLESYAFTTAAAIVGSVDRKIFVLMRDGRKLFGILRTFDQFANLVLQDAVERIYLNDENDDNLSPQRYTEAYRGVFMIRGENVVMMGELDIDTEDDHLEKLQKIPFPEAETELKARQAAKIKTELARLYAINRTLQIADGPDEAHLNQLGLKEAKKFALASEFFAQQEEYRKRLSNL